MSLRVSLIRHGKALLAATAALAYVVPAVAMFGSPGQFRLARPIGIAAGAIWFGIILLLLGWASRPEAECRAKEEDDEAAYQMSAIVSAHTPDGRWRVYLLHDQTADLYDGRRRVLLGVRPDQVAQYLEDNGVDPDELIPDR